MRVIDPVYAVLLGSSILFAVLLLLRRPGGPHVLLCLFTAIATILFGAWVCATLSTVDSRFMGRTAWLLPMMASLILWRMHAERRTA
jgi:ABC-type polysaccharide/polyol phosphate export permease